LFKINIKFFDFVSLNVTKLVLVRYKNLFRLRRFCFLKNPLVVKKFEFLSLIPLFSTTDKGIRVDVGCISITTKGAFENKGLDEIACFFSCATSTKNQREQKFERFF